MSDSKDKISSPEFFQLLGQAVLWALLFGGVGFIAASLLKEYIALPYLPSIVFLIFMSLGIGKISKIIRHKQN